ncbi:aromatic acid exporter family protein [Paenisporosarcina sp. TG-14]|uniref:aromatic acid exporter family protein n=1 Tax=Paenisporosarcina sp. TG-14 TaxID=1231057 RepID=UPI0002EEADC7|nr:aromatic acid exporter family protein [Paenisporosarcina sp. TG-14]
MQFRRFRIGYRTLKTAVGASIAMLIAMFLDLDYYSSAFILTVLCIQPTKRKSLRAVYSRIISTIIGVGFAFVFFEGIAYNPIVFGLLILLFIPTLVSFKLQDGFVSSVVILLHLFDAKSLTMSLMWNEFQLMAVGFGVALLVNIYMPDIEKDLKKYRLDLESLYAKIFHEVALYLRNGDSNWDGKELVQVSEVIEKGKALAYQDVENHLNRRQNLHYLYFDMREQQFEIIERVLPKITALPVTISHSQLVADFIEDLANHVHSGNTAHRFISKLDEVKEEFSTMPLPKDHENFLAMAALYQFIEEMEQYLRIKSNFIGFTTKKKTASKD